MKYIFLSLSAISLLSSVTAITLLSGGRVSEASSWEKDHRCWDLMCSKETRNQVPKGDFEKGIPCDCLDGECRDHRALTAEGHNELNMWINSTNNEINTSNFMHDEELEDSPNDSNGIVGGADAQRNIETDNERKMMLRPLKNKNSNVLTSAPSSAPTGTEVPTSAPISAPSSAPTDAPTDVPTTTTKAPTTSPIPTTTPTNAPSNAPTSGPSNAPSNAPTSGPTTTPSKLALGWRKWSCWQYETVQRQWCVTPRPYGFNLEIQECKDVSDKWTFNKVGTSQFVTIEHETLNKCWTMSGTQALLLKPCDGSDAQKWDLDSSEKTHEQLGDLGDNLFEIQLANSTLEGCVTQHHHPKAGERLYVPPCAISRSLEHQSNYWEKFFVSSRRRRTELLQNEKATSSSQQKTPHKGGNVSRTKRMWPDTVQSPRTHRIPWLEETIAGIRQWTTPPTMRLGGQSYTWNETTNAIVCYAHYQRCPMGWGMVFSSNAYLIAETVTS
eukprot:scaffold38725_cov52-Attheya_sp.AAC.5